MELNVTSAFKVFSQAVDRVAKYLQITDPSSATVPPQVESYINNRALTIFKLDLLLVEHRNQYDKDRFVLFGKNALNHYLFTKKNIPIQDAKKLDFHEVIMILWDDLSKFEIPPEVHEFIRVHTHFNYPDPQLVKAEVREFDFSEWEPAFADKLLTQ